MKIVNKYLEDLISIYNRNGWEIQEINTGAIRNLEGLESDGFNDILFHFSITKNFLKIARGTTDPSAYYIKTGGIPKTGAPFLCSGFQEKIYCMDKHLQKYPALCNREWKGCYPQRYIRDANRNFKLDENEKVVKGYASMNVHHAGSVPSEFIGKDSAGCQVYMYKIDQEEQVNDLKAEKMYYGTKNITLWNYAIFELPYNKIIENIYGELY